MRKGNDPNCPGVPMPDPTAGAPDDTACCPRCGSAELEGPGPDYEFVCHDCGDEFYGDVPAYYHVAPRAARSSILKHGIDWQRATTTVPRADDTEWPMANYLYGPSHAEYVARYAGDQDVWEVDVLGLSLLADPSGRQSMDDDPDLWLTTQPIEAHRLRLRSDDQAFGARRWPSMWAPGYHRARGMEKNGLWPAGHRSCLDSGCCVSAGANGVRQHADGRCSSSRSR